ncbi:nuclear transport factor 2 family protein [Parafrankia sp. EUN1f]|uniref:nuclear transport factor 2 family protein n=1 Tax=Parafrankia sp. EUN1f TaxID=102897 RepID=UPI0001C43E5D|nr:nuclear transport factor 2 family protein [Parafrankia sp. EUN1f]EFC85095.1 protein of unknown function DUF1486 [Parafrankia sp. EUN1f]
MTATPREVVEQALRAGCAMNIEALLALMAPDGHIEWPYHPTGAPARLNGRDEIRAYVASAAKAPIRWDDFVGLVMHETADPEVVIVEYEANGTVTTTGATYRQRIIAVFRVRNGQIVSYRDYLNPLALAEAQAHTTERG